MERSELVVIGNGMAGARFLEELISRGGKDRCHTTVFGDEPCGNYNRILLSEVLAGQKESGETILNSLEWYQQHDILLHAGVRAERIDTSTRRVFGSNGVVAAYDQLVIATGSSAFVPPISGLRDSHGHFKPGIFVFRTLEDCHAIVQRAATSKKAAVLGGGLLGLEAARGLLALGLEVHVVHLADHLMELQLDSRGGAILRRRLEGMGLHVHLKKNTREALGETALQGLRFEDGSTLECDLLIVSAGIRPNTQIAREAGLLVERGIVVGDDLRCPESSNIYAIGECVQHQGRTYGLLAPVWEQARILAQRLSGEAPRARYAGSKVSTKLKVMGIDLSVMGHREAQGADDEEVVFTDASNGIYQKLVVREGRLAGAILLGDDSAAASLLRAYELGATLPRNHSQLLFPARYGAAPSLSILEQPDEAQVCNCNGVSKGQIRQAVSSGHRSLKALCETTRAGTGCGSCRKDVHLLLEQMAGNAPIEDPSIHYYVPGVPLSKPELVREIRAKQLRSVSAVFLALAEGREDAASKPGLASLLKTLWGKDYEDERDARFINDRVHANIQKDGTFSVVPRIYGGVTSPDELRRIADVAERYQAKMVKITGGQRIDLLGIPKEHLPAVWRDLKMASGHAYTKAFRTCKTCVGTEFCRYGVGDSTSLGISIERRFQGIESPHKMKLATAGCPRNCSEATTKDLGAVAIEGGRWEIYVGGAAGSRVRKGDLLCVADSHEQVLKSMGRFIQYYREHGKYLERTYDFVERIGIERLRQILTDDDNPTAKQLDVDIQAAVEAYADPWKEADHPVHPAQFRSVISPLSKVG